MIQLRRFTLSLLLVLTGAPALALSCLPQDVARTYKEAQASEDPYIVVHGVLSFDESKLPKTDWENQVATPAETLIPAKITGTSLSRSGFTQPFDHEITLNAQCFGPWCAGAASGHAYLAFLKRVEGGYLLDLNPCGGMGFADPNQAQLKQVQTCFQGKSCQEKAFK